MSDIEARRQGEAEYNPERGLNDPSAKEYSTRDEYPVPVDEDHDVSGIDAETADSDQQLARDDQEAIDEGNIIGGSRTRGAKPAGTYREPGDDEGLPGPDDGTSAIST